MNNKNAFVNPKKAIGNYNWPIADDKKRSAGLTNGIAYEQLQHADLQLTIVNQQLNNVD